MCSIDLDPCEVWDEREVKSARKSHECDCCGGTIKPGESYVRHFSIYEGVVSSEKCCAPCLAARKEFSDVHGQMGSPSYTMELLRECFQGATRRDLSDTDRRWRTLYAQMLRRGRAAKREHASA